MKNLLSTVRFLIVIALMGAVSFSADAQLKGMLNKAKNAAKGAVETKANDSKEKTSASAASQSQSKTTAAVQTAVQEAAPAAQNDDDAPLYMRKFTISEEAKAIDTLATSTTVEDGFTRSITDIHATYEHLGGTDIYLYQPYYKYPEFYSISPHYQKIIEYSYNLVVLGLLKAQSVNEGYYIPVTPITMPDGFEANIPYDEYSNYAWTVQYIADPKSSTAFFNFAKVLVFKQPQIIAAYHFPMDDINKGIIKADKGWMLPANFQKARLARRDEALTLAINVLDISIVTQYLEQLYGAVGNAGSYFNLLYLLMGDAIYNQVYVQHKDYDGTTNEARNIDMLRMKADKQIGQLYEDLYLYYAEEVEMPKGVSVDATTKSRGIAAAKDFAKEEYVDVVFLRSTWEEFKEFDYPYRTTSFALPVAVITKKGNKYFTQNCALQKSPDGSNWFVSAGTGRRAPVKYK